VPAGRAETLAAVVLPTLGGIVHHEAMFTSEATTKGVQVSVSSEYAPERSRPDEKHWFFLYTITISNRSEVTVQLISRHWVITDGNGHVEEVKGPGVVGEQPVLSPGETFTYTSGCPLRTPFGKMEGTYQMVTADAQQFDAKIAPFTLSEPYTVH
jgi:ApaG protein